MSYKGVYNIGPRQLTSAFFIGILFMFQAALLSGGQVVVLDRSLVMTMFVGQFYFLTLLYFQTEVFKLSAVQKRWTPSTFYMSASGSSIRWRGRMSRSSTSAATS